ncbi:hypothetical protein T492DRAFT_517831 [Pavlovales sp. CCMP2436]|nr:hypothetical protein T492DRAFT_517831 [Pavlovales sp. CCMP2436]
MLKMTPNPTTPPFPPSSSRTRNFVCFPVTLTVATLLNTRITNLEVTGFQKTDLSRLCRRQLSPTTFGSKVISSRSRQWAAGSRQQRAAGSGKQAAGSGQWAAGNPLEGDPKVGFEGYPHPLSPGSVQFQRPAAISPAQISPAQQWHRSAEYSPSPLKGPLKGILAPLGARPQSSIGGGCNHPAGALRSQWEPPQQQQQQQLPPPPPPPPQQLPPPPPPPPPQPTQVPGGYSPVRKLVSFHDEADKLADTTGVAASRGSSLGLWPSDGADNA